MIIVKVRDLKPMVQGYCWLWVGGNGVRELVGGWEKWGGGKRGARSWGAGGGREAQMQRSPVESNHRNRRVK